MPSITVAVDLAKSVFQIAVADAHWRVIEQTRLTRHQFERWFANRDVALVVMEACGSAHHWGLTPKEFSSGLYFSGESIYEWLGVTACPTTW